jgi:dTDP-4-dehydrorhamnose reductase
LERRVEGIFNLAGALRLSRFDLAQYVAEIFELDSKYLKPVTSERMKWSARRPKDSSLNVEKATKEFAAKPLRIREALEIMKKEIHTSADDYFLLEK